MQKNIQKFMLPAKDPKTPPIKEDRDELDSCIFRFERNVQLQNLKFRTAASSAFERNVQLQNSKSWTAASFALKEMSSSRIRRQVTAGSSSVGAAQR